MCEQRSYKFFLLVNEAIKYSYDINKNTYVFCDHKKHKNVKFIDNRSKFFYIVDDDAFQNVQYRIDKSSGNVFGPNGKTVLGNVNDEHCGLMCITPDHYYSPKHKYENNYFVFKTKTTQVV